jgi:hypothetical protein
VYHSLKAWRTRSNKENHSLTASSFLSETNLRWTKVKIKVKPSCGSKEVHEGRYRRFQSSSRFFVNRGDKFAAAHAQIQLFSLFIIVNNENHANSRHTNWNRFLPSPWKGSAPSSWLVFNTQKHLTQDHKERRKRKKITCNWPGLFDQKTTDEILRQVRYALE